MSEDFYRDSISTWAEAGWYALLRLYPPNRTTDRIASKKVEESPAELAKMSDAELIEHGKLLRKSCRRLPGQKIDKEKLMQLNEARAEWQRRYPPKKFGANPAHVR
jgi:hypothetical protein